MNAKQQKFRLWPFVAVTGSAVVLAGLMKGWPSWVMAVVLVLALAATYAASVRDALKKTVVLFYEFDTAMEAAYANLHEAATKLAACGGTWHIEAQGSVFDRKYHAGASSLVRRKKTSIARTSPPNLKTNIETVAVGVGRQTLHFFPDRVLVYEANGVGAVGYMELQLHARQQQFIEDSIPPHDATVVGRTWRFVNKKGGPDRRFNNNRELPICLYDEIELASSTGLNEVVQVSCSGVGDLFVHALHELARSLPREHLSTAREGTVNSDYEQLNPQSN